LNKLTLITVLSEAVHREYPKFIQMPEKTQKSIVSAVLKDAVKAALQKVTLPKPKDPFRRQIEKFWFLRGGKHYKETHKQPDYRLLEELCAISVSQLQTDSTDWLSFGKIDSTAWNTKDRFSSQNNIEPKHSFDNYPKNDIHKSVQLFKTEIIDNDTLSSKTKVRNYLTRYKYKLEETGAVISPPSIRISTDSLEKPMTDERTIPAGSNVIRTPIQFTESLFLLYNLQTFVESLKILEEHVRRLQKIDLQEELDYAYEVLRNYYANLLLKHGIKIDETKKIENELLKIDEFVSLNPDNPLIQGYIELLSRSINPKRISELIDKSELPEIFNA